MTTFEAIRKNLIKHAGAEGASVDLHPVDSSTLAVSHGSVVVIVYDTGKQILVSASLDRGGSTWHSERVTEPIVQTFSGSDVAQIVAGVRDVLR